MSRIPFATVTIALALLAAALAGVGPLTERAVAAAPACPSSWPQQDYEGMFTDDADEVWFIIRSTDSNGYATVRAYPASNNYQGGYVVNSPDGTCYLRVRQAGGTDDLADPKQLDFPKEQEPEPERPAQASSPTLLELLNRLPPSERQAALICMLPLAGNRTLEELNNDPDFLELAIANGCLTP